MSSSSASHFSHWINISRIPRQINKRTKNKRWRLKLEWEKKKSPYRMKKKKDWQNKTVFMFQQRFFLFYFFFFFPFLQSICQHFFFMLQKVNDSQFFQREMINYLPSAATTTTTTMSAAQRRFPISFYFLTLSHTPIDSLINLIKQIFCDPILHKTGFDFGDHQRTKYTTETVVIQPDWNRKENKNEYKIIKRSIGNNTNLKWSRNWKIKI